MATTLPNVYHHRRVAATSSKGCFICYKPSDSVLITPDNRDFFYTCAGHLNDRGFAIPIVDPADDGKREKEEALKREIEVVKKEYEEKLKARKKGKGKKKDKDEKTGKEGKKDEDEDADADADAKAEKERDEKIKELEQANGVTSSTTAASAGPRIFALHKNIYDMRVNRLKNAQLAKRNQSQGLSQRASTSSAAPSTPVGRYTVDDIPSVPTGGFK